MVNSSSHIKHTQKMVRNIFHTSVDCVSSTIKSRQMKFSWLLNTTMWNCSTPCFIIFSGDIGRLPPELLIQILVWHLHTFAMFNINFQFSDVFYPFSHIEKSFHALPHYIYVLYMRIRSQNKIQKYFRNKNSCIFQHTNNIRHTKS